MSIEKITAEELRRMKDKEGLVLQGCGGDLQEWLLLGGCIAAAVLCCMQINRICDYDLEIKRLREKRNGK